MNNIQRYKLNILPIKRLQTISILPRRLPAYEVQLFTLHLSDIHQELTVLPGFLSSIERERAKHFYFDKDANLFIATHGLLRVILAHYLQISPRQVPFTTCSSGKPILPPVFKHHPISFNISHSGETALIAISSNAEIGVDVETIRSFDVTTHPSKKKCTKPKKA